MKRLFLFTLLSTAFLLSACDSKPEGFSEYGFYMRNGSEVTYLFNTKETYAVTLEDAARKTEVFEPGSELLIYMPGFNERRMLIYKGKPWTLYPRDTYTFVRHGNDNLNIRTERVDTDLHRISGENIPDSLIVGLSYMHAVENVLFSGFTTVEYEDAVKESLKSKRDNQSSDKAKFAKKILDSDLLDSTKHAAKRALSRSKDYKEAVADFYKGQEERYKTKTPTRKKEERASEGQLKNVIVDYIGAVNRKRYTLAKEYVTGREASNLNRYMDKETVLQPKQYTHSNIQGQSATFFVKNGRPTRLRKDHFGWKISEY